MFVTKQSASILLPQTYSHRVAKILWWKKKYRSVKTESAHVLSRGASRGMQRTTPIIKTTLNLKTDIEFDIYISLHKNIPYAYELILVFYLGA